jgi:putative ABC transport system permease protein
MKFLPFVFKHLQRNWLRTASTVAAMAVCIFLFCTLRTFLKAMDDTREYGNVTRLVVRHSISLVYSLPLAYEGRIAQIPGVKSVAISTWFGGSQLAKKENQASSDKKKKDAGSSGPDFSNFFTNLAVEDETYFPMHPEFAVPPDQMQAFREDQRACIIGRGLAKQYGWKPGHTFFLESFIPTYRKSTGPFEFVVRGIYDADLVREPAADQRVMYFHYKYLYESTGQRIGAGLYVVELKDPAQAASVARAIDATFANSDAETKTETEAAFRADFMAMLGNLSALFNAIGLAVIFTILLVTANTMSMAVRERRTEIAVLKTLGFSSGQVMGLILGEALAIGGLGGGLGLALAGLVIRGLPSAPVIGPMVRGFPTFGFHWPVAAFGLAMALAMGVLAGLPPAVGAYRARIVEMLRQV